MSGGVAQEACLALANEGRLDPYLCGRFVECVASPIGWDVQSERCRSEGYTQTVCGDVCGHGMPFAPQHDMDMDLMSTCTLPSAVLSRATSPQ